MLAGIGDDCVTYVSQSCPIGGGPFLPHILLKLCGYCLHLQYLAGKTCAWWLGCNDLTLSNFVWAIISATVKCRKLIFGRDISCVDVNVTL